MFDRIGNLVGLGKKQLRDKIEAVSFLAKGQAKELERLKIEREFWVEQSRNLSNQLQTWQRLYADCLQHLERGGVESQELLVELQLVREELRKPVVGVEAVRAMTALMRGDTQGEYTLTHPGLVKELA